jgi:uncharacterized membrane protein YvbJ
MICPNCGVENRDGAALCEGCGNRLTRDAIGTETLNEHPLPVEGQILWLDRYALLGLFTFAVMFVTILSVFRDHRVLAFVFLIIGSFVWLVVYSYLSRRGQR